MKARVLWNWSTLCALSVVVALAGCQKNGAPKITVPVVDVHTHLFNARDLPLAGILNAQGVPADVAESLAAVINWWTPDEEDRQSRAGTAKVPPGPATEDLRRVTATIRANTSTRRGRAPGGSSLLAPLTPLQRARLVEFAGRPAPATRDGGGTRATTPDEADVETVARALARAQFPPGDSHVLGGPLTDRGALADLGGYVRFLGVVTSSHARIARQMSDRQYPPVRLFVHHMMDMAATYADAPALPFDRQWDAMARLDASAGGKLVHFVAYDPFRRGDALDYVKRGVAAGAIGVKFYPPSGYSATRNVIEPQPRGDAGAARRWRSRYGGDRPLDAAAIDALNRALFQYCVDNDLPIFTHCTSTGFESVPGYGLKSDPKYWAATLEEFPNLRLCFGHAGGDSFWFSPPADDVPATGPVGAAFGAEVVRLCLAYPNVYCEAGYLERILDPANSGNFKARLGSIIDRPSTAVDGGGVAWKFGDKFMYGTDWFMISLERHPERYLADFWRVFNEDAALRPWAGAFFGRNAVKFLRLADVAGRPDGPFTPAQRAYWQKLVADVQGP
jgi:predicted TIM-barrel fold metal-dependent hydrolase